MHEGKKAIIWFLMSMLFIWGIFASHDKESNLFTLWEMLLFSAAASCATWFLIYIDFLFISKKRTIIPEE